MFLNDILNKTMDLLMIYLRMLYGFLYLFFCLLMKLNHWFLFLFYFLLLNMLLLFSQMFCITFSFFTNKYFVFKTKGNVKEEYLRFFAFYGFYLLLNLLCLPFLVEVIQITPILAQTLFSFAIIVSSYFWHNLVTFKQTKESL